LLASTCDAPIQRGHVNGRQVLGRWYDRLWEIPRRPCRNFLPGIRNLFDLFHEIVAPAAMHKLLCVLCIGSLSAGTPIAFSLQHVARAPDDCAMLGCTAEITCYIRLHAYLRS
jgi:hypothetical protein